MLGLKSERNWASLKEIRFIKTTLKPPHTKSPMNSGESVPILRIPFSEAERKTYHDDIDKILDSGYLTQGEYTERFENAFAEFVGTDHAIACSSGTSALELAIRGLGVEGQSVVVPTNTFMATAFAAMHAGNRVIFADSNPETFALDPIDVRKRISEDTSAIVLVHIGGIVTDEIEEIRSICEEHQLSLIEDAAHAHGSSIEGENAGTLGDVAAFSFYPTKVLTTGEGGVVTTDDDALADMIKCLRNHGKNPTEDNAITEFGYNWRMDELTAALGLRQIEGALDRIGARKKIASFYDEKVPSVPGMAPLELPAGSRSSYYKYVVILDDWVDRAELKTRMSADYDVGLTGEVYASLCHDEPLWEDVTYCGAGRNGPDREPACEMWPQCGCDTRQTVGFDGAEQIANSHVCLPIYPDLSMNERTHVIKSLRSVMEEMESERS